MTLEHEQCEAVQNFSNQPLPQGDDGGVGLQKMSVCGAKKTIPTDVDKINMLLFAFLLLINISAFMKR